jgi:hypothetical protein
VIRFPLLAATLAIYFGVRYLSRRRQETVVRLRNGRRVTLLSSVALLSDSADLLALEYSSALPDPAPEELRLEARSLVQTVGARAQYAACRDAIVTVRDLTFSFHRGDSGNDWYPIESPS